MSYKEDEIEDVMRNLKKPIEREEAVNTRKFLENIKGKNRKEYMREERVKDLIGPTLDSILPESTVEIMPAIAREE